MPASTSIESTARERMKTILLSVLSSQNRVALGLVDIGVSDANFFDNLISCGIYVVILGAETDNLDAVNRLYTFSVKVRLYYGFVSDTSEDYKGINDIVKECWQALVSYANYTDCLPPTSLGYNKVSDVAHGGAVAGPVGCYEMRFQFLAGADCV